MGWFLPSSLDYVFLPFIIPWKSNDAYEFLGMAVIHWVRIHHHFSGAKLVVKKTPKNGSSSQKTWLVGGFNPSQEYAHHLKQSSQVWLKNNTYWNPELMIDTWFDVDPPTKAALEFIVLTGKHLSCGDQKQPIINHLLWPPLVWYF